MNISPIINYFVSQGVPAETVILILMLPVIATFIAFLRQVLGIKAFGIYTPLLVTFAFLATNGLKYGVAIFLTVIISGLIIRFVLKSFRLLYLPRVAIMLSVVSLAVLFMLALGGGLKRTGLASVSIFPILIMITIVEKFIAVQIEKGNRTAIMLAFETLIISIFGYYLLHWTAFIGLIQAYPWIVVFTLPINIFLGKWKGLRLIEYLRFREVIKKM
jgi:hypothetical protein